MENIYLTEKQAENLKTAVASAFDYEIKKSKELNKKINATLIFAMIEARFNESKKLQETEQLEILNKSLFK